MLVLKQYDLLKYVYFICTDGAPVVLSPINGLVGKMLNCIPHLVSNHCIAHRSCLCVKDLSG